VSRRKKVDEGREIEQRQAQGGDLDLWGRDV
jgi:hypothetical protein